MSRDQEIDLIMAVAVILVGVGVTGIAGILLWALMRGTRMLRDELKAKDDIFASIHKLWERINEIELRHGIRSDASSLARLKRMSDALAAALNDIEKQQNDQAPK